MTTLKGKLSTNVPIDPKLLKLGSADADAQLSVSRAVKRSSHKINQLQLNYLKSYSDTNYEERTLLHLRDLLFSYAISICSRSVLTKDLKSSELTTQAFYLYRNYNISELIPTHLEENNVTGSFSSISFLFKEVGIDWSKPLTSYQRLLDYFFDQYFLDPPSSIWEKNEAYLDFLPNDTPSVISTIEEENLTDDKVAFLRQNLLIKEDWSFLKERLLFGECRQELYQFLEDTFEGYQDLRAKMLKPLPYGSVGFYLGLAAQGYLNAAKAINTLAESTLLTSLEDFYQDYDSYLDVKALIAKHIVTTFYAFGYLQWFNTLAEARSQQAVAAKLLKQLTLPEELRQVDKQYKLREKL